MACHKFSRRDFLSSTALASLTVLFAGSALLGACSDPSQPSTEEGFDPAEGRQTLARFARHLYPHDGVEDTVYTEISDRLATEAVAEGPFIGALNDGLSALEGENDAPWLALPPRGQIAIMKEQEGQPYFSTLQAHIREALYNHPAVWEVIGYPGPSAHLGGYIDRGFDDIDWLPEVD